MVAKRNIAEGYFNRITSGHRNAVARPDLSIKGNESVDRALRELINEANKNGDCIINVGNGYYRPDPTAPVDCLEYELYRSFDNSKARDLTEKGACMDTTFENWRRESGVAV